MDTLTKSLNSQIIIQRLPRQKQYLWLFCYCPYESIYCRLTKIEEEMKEMENIPYAYAI